MRQFAAFRGVIDPIDRVPGGEKVQPQFLSLRHCLRFCVFHTNGMPRANSLVQVHYVRVVDLDIEASKSDV
jgi:hypothetical protein